MNARRSQSTKIKELGDALLASGFLTLDQQAQALGLARSTTWTILQANHKGSGLSAAVINRMLRAPQLPPLVRATILVYIDEKTAGLYGHSKLQLRRFSARLSDQRCGDPRTKLAAEHHAARRQFGRGPLTFVALADVGIE
jgi:predicted DNA-binding transcriptional regulator AlpA